MAKKSALLVFSFAFYLSVYTWSSPVHTLDPLRFRAFIEGVVSQTHFFEVVVRGDKVPEAAACQGSVPGPEKVATGGEH